MNDTPTARSANVFSPITSAWGRFWFEPISTVSIALFRMVYGVLLIACIVLLLPDLLVWFGAGGPFTVQDSLRFWGDLPSYSILIWFPQPAAVFTFFAIFSLAALCLLVGFCTRAAAVIVFLCLVSIGHRNPLILHGGDTALRMMAFYLILAPAGASLSIDRLIAVARGKEGLQSPLAPPWAQRLLQLQISLIYAMTVLMKLRGAAWQNGTALYYTSRLDDFHRFPMPFVFDSIPIVNLLTYFTLAAELALAFLVWNRALRPVVLLSGVALHLGIEYSMNIPLFAFTMIAGYLAFVDVEAAWERLLVSRPSRGSRRATLYAGGDCPRCLDRATALRSVDIFRRIETVLPRRDCTAAGIPPTAPATTRLTTSDGHSYHGAAAWRWLAWRTPLLWPAALLSCLTGARELARVMDWWLVDDQYDRRAAQRIGAESQALAVGSPSDGMAD